MSLSATTSAVAATASSAISLHPHGHKRGIRLDTSTDSTATTSGQAPATTQGLFSSLFSTLAQLAVGTNPIASAAMSALTAAAPATGPSNTSGNPGTLLQSVQSNGGHASNSLGGNVNAKA